MTTIAYVVVVSAVLIGGFFFLNRPQLISINADIPKQFPLDSFSHEVFEELLGRYVDSEGKIDYAGWHGSTGDRALLDRYLAAVSRFSPARTPERFAKRSEQLAYWLYAYNAYVIRSVLENWPLQSVTDVKAPIEAVKGLGFFYRQRFLFGGDALSLYAVEHEKILATYRDPRIHFVLIRDAYLDANPDNAELRKYLDDALDKFDEVYAGTRPGFLEGYKALKETIKPWGA